MTVSRGCGFVLLILGCCWIASIEAFTLPSSRIAPPLPTTTAPSLRPSPSCLSAREIEEDNADKVVKKRRWPRWLVRTCVVVATPFLPAFLPFVSPPRAHASAPVMALPKQEARDPIADAISEHERRMVKKTMEEMQQFTAKARQIEATQGQAARLKFEKDHRLAQEQQAIQQQEDLVQLKRDLLDQGIDPFNDLEGKRQVLLKEKGVDLADVPGTQFNLEQEYLTRNPAKSFAKQKETHRQIIKCMVEDMKNRDVDPLEYFQSHQDKTADILDLPILVAKAMLQDYQQNLQEYGQITKPQPGELSAKEKKQDPNEQKRLAKEEKARLAAIAKEEKLKAKARAKEEKQAAKARKKAEKEAAKAAAAASAASAPAAVAEQLVDEVLDETEPAAEESETEEEISAVVETPASTAAAATSASKGLKIVPVATVLVGAGGGGYAFKVWREKNAEDEAERQRQLRLLMGDMDKDTKKEPTDAIADTADDEDDDMLGGDESLLKGEEKHREGLPDTPAVPSKKRRRGLKSVFAKKKNDRETDIGRLVGAAAPHGQFASVLAKILTFGAPGRFPDVVSLPGEMPMQSFDLEAAKQLLIDSRTTEGMTTEESAEVFANVVNCMLIDIVDLASASLKEKDDKVTVSAIGIVVDFMNHAASLYDAVAEGVSITPVTYGGDLSKAKLEQMYGVYASSGMTDFASMDENFESRVGLLQDVFQISEKKADGLMMKAMQKNMMKMLKSGEGMEGLEEMMKGGGMPGMEGLAGMDAENMDPQQLKEMLTALKELKDSGSIPPDEMEAVKSQFKEAFGSSIDDVMKDADASGDELTQDDKELLDLMKSILDD